MNLILRDPEVNAQPNAPLAATAAAREAVLDPSPRQN